MVLETPIDIHFEWQTRYTHCMALTKQITVRMPVDLVAELRAHGNTASYIIDAVRDKLRRDQKAEIVASLQCLAGDEEANDISDFAATQDEVIARGD